MAVPNTMDALEWLRKHLEGEESNDLLREMVRAFAERLMAAEVDVLCGAGYGEVSSSNATTNKYTPDIFRKCSRIGKINTIC